MAYKIQLGAAHLDGLVSGSSTVSAVGSVSSSGDLAVTGNVHAAALYGNGSGLTNISADGIDVTSSAGDLAYKLVFTQDFQTDGTLGLGANSALNYNPNDGVLSSSAGLQLVSEAVLGGDLDVSGAITFASTASLSDLDVTGAISASSTLQVVGATIFGSSVNVSGALSLASTVAASGLANLDGGIEVDSGGNKFTVSTAGAVVAVSSISGAAGNFEGLTGTSLNLQEGGITNAGAIAGATTLAASGLANLDGGIEIDNGGNKFTVSSAGAVVAAATLDVGGLANLDGGIEIDNGGNKFTVSTAGVVSGALGVSGSDGLFDGQVSASAFFGDGSSLTGIDSVSGSERQYSATGMETSGYLKVSGSVTLAGAVSSSAGAQVVGNVILGGQLAVSGGAQYGVTTVTTNTHLTASNATMYQVVSGGTAALQMMLPSASDGENYQYAIKRHALMSGNVTITGSDIGDVIDGNASLVLETAGASVFLISDGTQWNIF